MKGATHRKITEFLGLVVALSFVVLVLVVLWGLVFLAIKAIW